MEQVDGEDPDFMRSAFAWIGKVSTFAWAVVINSAVSFLSIPLVVSTIGPDGWGVVALGQSLGAILGVFTSWGWGITGVPDIAGSPRREQYSVVRQASTPRFLLFAFGGTVLAVVALLVSPTKPEIAAAVTAAYGAQGLSLSWALVGLGKAKAFILTDVVPRAACTLTGALLLTISSPFVLPAMVLLGNLLAHALATVFIRRTVRAEESAWLPLSMVWPALRSRAAGIVTDLASTAYLSLPVVAVGVLAAPALPVFAMSDRVMKFSKSAFWPVVQAFQGWAFKVDGDDKNRRVTLAIRIFSALGIIACVGFMPLILVAAPILSDGEIAVPISLALPMALAFGLSVVIMGSGMIGLTAFKLFRELAIGTVLAAAIVVMLLVPAAHLWGGQGVAWLVVIAESTVLLQQRIALRRRQGNWYF